MNVKTQLESIHPDDNSSFRLLHNPRLSDLFYWHFHPEYELVYIEGANGTRHVGDHISLYEYNDLVLIGSGIPHLNFDYGVKSDYTKVVLHIQPAFVDRVIQPAPELTHIQELFVRAAHGIAFQEDVKMEVGQLLLSFDQASPFGQFQLAFRIFDLLAQSDRYELLHPSPYANRTSKREQQRLTSVYEYVDRHYPEKIRLDDMATLCNLTKPAFCRYFRQATGHTFISWLHQFRVSQAKRLMMMGQTVTEACFASGFDSLSYFNRIFNRVSGENPSDFLRRQRESRSGIA